MAQEALDRWWWPALMMFGPPDAASTHSSDSQRWKIKRFSNDELRQKFVDFTVPQAAFLGISVPDPELRWNEKEQRHEFGAIDWSEFERVLKGDGPCNAERLAARRRAWAEGAWVREAASAYAESSGAAPRAARHERPHPAGAGSQGRRGGEHGPDSAVSREWPLYEVFIRARGGLDHKHVGSLHATDARMAIEHARDLYTRRQEGVSIWVVRSSDIAASDPQDAEALFEPARDKIYRHPTFYDIPDEVKTL